MKKSIKIKHLLNQAREALEYAENSIDLHHNNGLETATQYLHEASTIIEIVETHQCGSVGGFGEGFTGQRTLDNRLAYLEEVYL